MRLVLAYGNRRLPQFCSHASFFPRRHVFVYHWLSPGVLKWLRRCCCLHLHCWGHPHSLDTDPQVNWPETQSLPHQKRCPSQPRSCADVIMMMAIEGWGAQRCRSRTIRVRHHVGSGESQTALERWWWCIRKQMAYCSPLGMPWAGWVCGGPEELDMAVHMEPLTPGG